MNIARFSVHRPVFTIMVTLIVIILGGISLFRLPVDLMPDITYPTLSISTTYENASPEEIEELVTRPIEEAMSAVPGVEEVTSISSEGSSNVRVTFAWGTDLDAAANDIRDRLDRVIRRLPDDADRPSLRKFDLASFPILILGASSHLDPVQMRRIIDDQVKYRIERVPGVASLDVWGGLDREIHVDLDPRQAQGAGHPARHRRDPHPGRQRQPRRPAPSTRATTRSPSARRASTPTSTSCATRSSPCARARPCTCGDVARRDRHLAEGHPHRARQRQARRPPVGQQAVRHQHRGRRPGAC